MKILKMQLSNHVARESSKRIIIGLDCFALARNDCGNHAKEEGSPEKNAYNACNKRKIFTPNGSFAWIEKPIAEVIFNNCGNTNKIVKLAKDLQAWDKFPMRLGAPVPLLGALEIDKAAYTRVLNAKHLNDTITDDEGKRWFKVIDTPAQTAENNLADIHDTAGWAKEEGQTGVALYSTWAFPGFEMLEFGNASIKDLFFCGIWAAKSPRRRR